MGVESEKAVQLFLNIGLDERTAKNTVANNKVTKNLLAVIDEVGPFHLILVIRLLLAASIRISLYAVCNFCDCVLFVGWCC